MEAKFKGILDKFMQSTHSMEEVYTELTYLTTNYNKEIEKVHKELEDQRAKANNEEFMRKEAEKSLADLKALQQINFSTIVDDLIKKPRDEFNSNIKSSLTRFTFSMIIIALIASVLSVAGTYLYLTNTNPITQTPIKSVDNKKEFEKLIIEMKKENEELKAFIKENIKPIEVPIKEKVIELKMEEPKEDKKETNESEVKKEEEEIKNSDKPELTLDTKEELMEKILTAIQTYDNKFKLNSKNDSRLLYKMFLLDLSPFKHDIFIQELQLFAKAGTYVPSAEEIKIWDKQMLHIYTKMLEKYKATPENKRTASMRLFFNYQENDATQYQGWEYVGEDGLSIEQSLEKEIERLNAQIVLNN